MRVRGGTWVLALAVMVPSACGGSDFTTDASGGTSSGGATSGGGGSGALAGAGGGNTGGGNTGGGNTGGGNTGGGNTGGGNTGGGNTGGGGGAIGDGSTTDATPAVVYGEGTCPATTPTLGTSCTPNSWCCYGYDDAKTYICAPTSPDGGGPNQWVQSGSSRCCPSSHPTPGSNCSTNSNLVCCYPNDLRFRCDPIPQVDVWVVTTNDCSGG
jgi:hypothetical protein